MCGISGFIGRNKHDTTERLKLMIGQVRHRGPDGFGLYADNNAGLAHARLSIIDLSGGAQPIHNEDKTIWVTFNGEIFNYVELREILEHRGHKFYTNTDTEVIVHGYEEWGSEFIKRLNGQYAIGLWDSKTQSAMLIRDHVGIQPLFYAEHNGVVYFASEIKSLLVIPELRKGLSERGLAETFTYWSTIPRTERTVFNGIHELAPGTFYQIRLNGISRQVQYWVHNYVTLPGMRSEEHYAHKLEQELVASTKLRFRSDVPVAAYLSGGLDSTSIVSLVKHNNMVDDLRTFSIEFEDKEFDESSYQKEVIDMLGIKHTSFRCTKQDVAQNFMRAIYHTERPILRTAPVPMMLLSGMVRDTGYRVVLTGEGADETLAGYDIFRENMVRRYMINNPNDTHTATQYLRQLYPWMGDRLTKSESYLKEFLGTGDITQTYFSHEPRWKTTSKSHAFFSDKIKEAAMLVDYHDAGCYAMTTDSLQKAQEVEYQTLFAGYLISSQGDRMVMANGIEGRYPFLDPNFMEFADRLPSQMKLNEMNEKYLLKKVMKGKIPDSIYNRKKQPYMAPDAACFFNLDTPEYVHHLLSHNKLEEYGYFNPFKVAMLKKKFEKGMGKSFADNMSFVGILSTQILHYLFVENFEPKAAPKDEEFLVNVNNTKSCQ